VNDSPNDTAPAPVYRGSDGGAVLPYRQHHRENWPRAGSRDGTVVSDLDLFLRRYSHTNPAGCFALIEYKHGDGTFTTGQQRMFAQLHDLLSVADPNAVQYRGSWLVRWRHAGCSGGHGSCKVEEGPDSEFVPISARRLFSKIFVEFASVEHYDQYFKTILHPDWCPSERAS
jgi:hypothetical protein